jgi:hypothetical protein
VTSGPDYVRRCTCGHANGEHRDRKGYLTGERPCIRPYCQCRDFEEDK